MNSDSCKTFSERLEELQEFPCVFPFKFIVPVAMLTETKALFPNESVSVRHSSGGKYASVSVDITVDSADIVMAVYEKASMITGLLAL